MVGRDADSITFQATTPSFSTFAISGQRAQETEAAVEEPLPEQVPQETVPVETRPEPASNFIYDNGLTVAGIVIVFVATIYLFFRRKGK